MRLVSRFLAAGSLLLGLLGSAEPAAAQCHAGFTSHSVAHRYAGPAETVKLSEHTNQLGFRGGALLARDGQGTFFAGLMMEATRFVGPNLQVGGRLAVVVPSSVNTNFGYDATGPVLRFVNLGPNLRYALRNSQHWRLDALGGPGLNWYYLADYDRQVTSKCGCSGPALVTTTVRPLLDAGLGLTYKLSRQLWFTSDLHYAQLLGSAPFGTATLRSQWQLSVAVTLPSGFVPRAAVPITP